MCIRDSERNARKGWMRVAISPSILSWLESNRKILGQYETKSQRAFTKNSNVFNSPWCSDSLNAKLNNYSSLRSPYERVFSKREKRVRYRGISKNQFAVFMQSICFNLKRVTVLSPPKFASPLGTGVSKSCQNQQIATIKVKGIKQKHEKGMLWA